MAAKRKPAITGLHSEGVMDDIIIPIAKRVLKGKTKEKAMSAVLKSTRKGSAKAGNKYEDAVLKKVQGGFFNTKVHPSEHWIKPNHGMKKQLIKNYKKANLGNALIAGTSTKGVKKGAKQEAKSQLGLIANPFGPSNKYHRPLSPVKFGINPPPKRKSLRTKGK